MHKANYLRRALAIVLAFFMVVTILPMGAFAQEPGNADEKSVRHYEANPDGSKNTGWPLGNIPLINMYSGISDLGTGSTNFKYLKTDTDDQGKEYVEILISQVGRFEEDGKVTYERLSTDNGYWSNMIIHFDDILFNNIDLDKSYILGEKDSNGHQRNFYFNERKQGLADPYNTDGKSVTVPLLSIFTKSSQNWQRHEATLRLYTKDDSVKTLIPGANYLIEYRIGAKPSNRNGVYFRNYVYGIPNDEVNAFEYPDYVKHTGSLNFPYRVEIKDPTYSTSQQDAMKNVHTEIYVDWENGELHVNYLYENM